MQSDKVEGSTLTDVADLRRVYRMPAKTVLAKSVPRIDPAAAGFIALSPLVIIATGDGTSIDASPRGGTPGFVRVLDTTRVAFGDLTGNNRLDSFSNLVQHPAIGMIFFVPGTEELLRVNGTARLSTDPELRQRCEIDGRVPNVAVEVTVQECYVHCGAALRRSSIWDATTWPAERARPSAGRILTENLELDHALAPKIDADLQEYYRNDVWNVGGEADGQA
ncbi:MAG: MSMEG_1061 family FMN-dependent PPOX-type flavoprotein [Acidimicrobiia bacterium]